jgi:hypothetical protein
MQFNTTNEIPFYTYKDRYNQTPDYNKSWLGWEAVGLLIYF